MKLRTIDINKPIKQNGVTVYFDGSCPICRREINFYRASKGAEAISWVDISQQTSSHCASDLTCEAALKRFHVRRSDGKLLSGAAAFAELWMALPRFSWIGRIVSYPGIRHVADIAYSIFLGIRPLIQRLTPR